MEIIPDGNLFMYCERPNPTAFTPVPTGFSQIPFTADQREAWVTLQCAHGKEDPAYLREVYDSTYAGHPELFPARWVLLTRQGKLAATCQLWEAYPGFETIHWLATDPILEGRGLARAALSAVLRNHTGPVWLHTQPASYRAIKLYTDFGFALLTDPVIGKRENHLTDVLPVLSRVMTPASYERLRFAQCPRDFWKAAAACPENRF